MPRSKPVSADGLEGPTFFNASIVTDIAVEGNHSAGGNAIVGKTTSGSYAAVAGENGSSGPGLYGTSNGGPGVQGIASGDSGIGIEGVAPDGQNGVGVYGTGSSFGVVGSGVFGVQGYSSNSSGAGVYGYGFNQNPGVLGVTSTSAGGQPAIQGLNRGAGPGVVGFSGTGTGVGGGSGTGTGFGGVAVGAGGIGVAGQATDPSGYAGVFTGGKGVLIQGNLTVTGSVPKSAAVRGAHGDLVRLYCVESPESWFEDFGSGQLNNGSAKVDLEPGFAGVVKTDQYRVFPVANGDCKGLYISNRTPTSFTVHESQGGTSNVAFDYRIVAKRKDIEGKRLEHVDEPPIIDLSMLAEPPAMPTTPPRPSTPPGHGG
jgi:hypothetical protein